MGAVSSKVPLREELEEVWAMPPRGIPYALCGIGLVACLLLGWTHLLPWSTARPSSLDMAMAVSTALLFVGVLVAMRVPRRRGAVGEPIQGDGRVHLPIRRGRHVLICLAWLDVPVMCALAAQMPYAGRREGAALFVIVLPMLFYYLPKRLMTDHRLRLEPKGFWYSQFLKPHFIQWADVRDVTTVPGEWELRIVLRRSRYARLLPYRYRWTPSALGAVITYYAKHPEARAELTDVRALDKFRDVPVAVSTD